MMTEVYAIEGGLHKKSLLAQIKLPLFLFCITKAPFLFQVVGMSRCW